MLNKHFFSLLKYNIINSSYFRSLQYKSQLLPLANAYNKNYIVQNRLTHSLQVACIAKFIGEILINDNEIKFPPNFLPALEIAGLVHDIGITPFGHTGERAIRDWWATKGVVINPYQDHTEYLLDFTNFDGNAQGLRILVNLFKLDHDSLKSYLKYTHAPSVTNRKAGYFLSEQRKLYDLLGLKIGDHISKDFSSYLVETADDIANALGDLKDCLSIGIIDQLHFKSWIEEHFDGDVNVIKEYLDSDFQNSLSDILEKVTIRIAKSFISFYQELQNNRVKSSVASADYSFIKLIRKYISVFVYNDPVKSQADLSGYKAVQLVLQNFSQLLQLSSTDFRRTASKIESIPKPWLNLYLQATDNISDSQEWYLRMHLIIDCVSSMTNQQIMDSVKI